MDVAKRCWVMLCSVVVDVVVARCATPVGNVEEDDDDDDEPEEDVE